MKLMSHHKPGKEQEKSIKKNKTEQNLNYKKL